MGRKLDNVISLYVDGIGTGQVSPAADKYLTPNFIDHLGLGFVAAYEPFERYIDRLVWPLRAFEDGPKVFLHSYQSFGRGMVSRVSIDVFDTDPDDQLSARWSISAPVGATRSGRSQIDGPTCVEDLDDTDANKALVARFLADVLVEGAYDHAPRYLDERDYAEHSPAIADGLTGFQHHLHHCVSEGTPIRYEEPDLLVGLGNYVAALSRATLGGPTYTVFDLYRLACGRIVEHWDAAATLS